MKNKKILFIINGLGLGNSTRCSAIIHELVQQKWTIDVITSSNGLDYFRKSDEIQNVFSYKSLLYGKTSGKLSVPKTFFSVPGLLFLFLKNSMLLRSILKNNRYEAIVFDSDYTVASLLLQKQRPLLIAINNAVVVVNECRKISSLPHKIRLQYWIEKMDYWFHNTVPDLVICPLISTENKTLGPKIYCTAPIVRSGLARPVKTKTIKNILVMLSGSQFGTDVNFLSHLPKLNNIKISVLGKEGVSNDQILFYGKVYNNHALINQADALIINAGFSAISEAIALKTPAVIIPIENHAEQYINSRSFEKQGLGLIATQENAHEKIMTIISDFQKYTEAHARSNIGVDGAVTASQIIEHSIFNRKNQT